MTDQLTNKYINISTILFSKSSGTPNRPNTSRPNQSNNSIVPTNAARGHMLYPMLDIAIKYSFQAIEGIKRVESSVTQLKGEMKGMQNAINELRDLIKSQKKSTFSLKEEGYEVQSNYILTDCTEYRFTLNNLYINNRFPCAVVLQVLFVRA